ncbi:MAG: patatin-like phospholipase family protein [Phycisphaerales bacterium]
MVNEPESPTTTAAATVPVARSTGLALCLSGGGFRATLFHLGALRRLNELAVLARVETVTSVSGGSILNGVLATRWSELSLGTGGVFANYDKVVADPVREFCARDLRTPLLVGTRLNPVQWPTLVRDLGAVPGNALAGAYQRLCLGRQLAQLPAPAPGGVPRFVFCATNVQTGACWHFHGGPGGRMGDFYTGYTECDGVSVAEAVAASSAFPPGFGALRLPAGGRTFTRVDPWGDERASSKKRKPLGEQAQRVVLLTDGGVYDNLGVEPVWTRGGCVLVSDAGRPFSSQTRCWQALVPRLRRATEVSMEQVGAVRKRWLPAR